MSYQPQPALPVNEVIPDLLHALDTRDEVVLQAPPGAGKTSLVPLALLSASWLGSQRILMLEPRRLAAKAAAQRLASHLGEKLGQRVGYRMRLDTKESANTRLLVVTEGVLTRMLQTDPSLEGIGLIIFDEFHERSLDADLGLALALNGRRVFRQPADGGAALKILLMSATLDDQRYAALLGGDSDPAPVIKSEGRQFPVALHYCSPWVPGEDVCQRVASKITQLIPLHEGSMLVFLPGQREIRRVAQALEGALQGLVDTNGSAGSVLLTPLYGDLSLMEQSRAIEPAPAGKRKVVLATALAESSLTIEGVSVVIDSGLSRSARFDPRSGMTRLHTGRVSRAASIQRMGRAGRVEAGHCYRLWSESQQSQLRAFSDPEILQADLAPLALQLLNWGVAHPDELAWLDAPPEAAFRQGLELLLVLQAAHKNARGQWVISEHGKAMAAFPSHPRLAHMLLVAARYGLESMACRLGAVLMERDPLVDEGADISLRLELFEQEGKGHKGLVQRWRQQSKLFASLCEGRQRGKAEGRGSKVLGEQIPVASALGFLLACAYPDRIAARRGPASFDYLLSSGRAAQLRSPDALQANEWLVIAQLGSQAGSSQEQIYLAAPLDRNLFEGALASLVETQPLIEWDKQQERFLAETQRKVGRLVLSSEAMTQLQPEVKLEALLNLVRKRGLDLLPWSDSLQQWRARVTLLRKVDLQQSQTSEWPDLSDATLLNSLDDWLGPHLAPCLNSINRLSDFEKLDLAAILSAALPWPLPQQLESLAPEKLLVPSGSRIPIDYAGEAPVLAVRLQEMFACSETPTIAGGKVTLTVHLLSPARRPLAVTQDLASFWRQGYPEVKKEMKGRYPKHPWPDDPLAAIPTSRAKPRK